MCDSITLLNAVNTDQVTAAAYKYLLMSAYTADL